MQNDKEQFVSVCLCVRTCVCMSLGERERGRKEPKDAYCDPGRCETGAC